MQKILLIDDEQRMLNLLELFLVPHGFVCLKAESGEKGIEMIQSQLIDLVILDIMMPYMDGWEVCKMIRQQVNVPIIMLTARADKLDVIRGLDVGADDYVTKPFDEGELVARVNALLRRAHKQKEENTTVNGEFILSHDAYSLKYRHVEAFLTLKEYSIVNTLISNPKKTFTREQLLLTAWDYNTYTDIRTVDSHIRNLREKLKTAGFPIDEFLHTVWGIGYKWE